MPIKSFNYCPLCGKSLITMQRGDRERLACPDSSCGFVHWDNPTPVVAAVLEHQGNIVLVRSHGWPEKWFGLVTGFLEKGESPEEAVLREVKEETGLEATSVAFIGHYPFAQMNQIIIAYHVEAKGGEIVLDTQELAGYKEVPIEKVKPWPMATGLALRDWLERRR